MNMIPPGGSIDVSEPGAMTSTAVDAGSPSSLMGEPAAELPFGQSPDAAAFFETDPAETAPPPDNAFGLRFDVDNFDLRYEVEGDLRYEIDGGGAPVEVAEGPASTATDVPPDVTAVDPTGEPTIEMGSNSPRPANPSGGSNRSKAASPSRVPTAPRSRCRPVPRSSRATR